MARRGKKSTEESQTTDKQHNAKARKATIVEVCGALKSLEAERESISEQIRELKNTRIKGDLGIKIADFNAAYRLYQLEDDARDTFLDTIRETFEALGIGQQLDWLKAADDAGVSDQAVKEARAAGREAGAVGKASTSNPHPKKSALRGAWEEGWLEAQDDLAETLGRGEQPSAPH